MVRHNGDGRGWRGFLMGMLWGLATRGQWSCCSRAVVVLLAAAGNATGGRG